MKNAIIRCVDDGTTFVGVVNDKGATLEVRWTGVGTTAVFRWLDAHRAQGAVDMEVGKGGLINCSLQGPVPPGWSTDDFAPPSR